MSIKFDSNNAPYIQLDDTHIINLDTSPVTEASKQVAVRELRETPEVVEPALKELRLLVKDEPGLTVPINDDEFLIKFLRPCKFYPTSAFEKIKNFYKFRVKHKKICKDLMPESVYHVFEQELMHLQPERDQFGRRLIIINVGKIWKPSKCPLDDIFRSIQLCLEAAMLEVNTQINGVIVIFNMDGLSLTHIMQFTPSLAMMILDWVQDCIALRLKAVHIVNNSYLFNMLFTIFKPFIREKLRKRIYFHNKDWNSLHQHVTKAILRPKFGGTLDAPEIEGKLIDEPGLTVPINDDEFLIKFLRPCKFYPTSAFEKIKNFYKFRVKHKKICKDLMPESVYHVFEQELMHLQPERDQFGRRLIIINVGKIWKPSKCPLDDIFRSIQLCLEAAMLEVNTQINGVIVIFNMDGLSLTHIMQFTPSLAMMILDWVQDCIALRLKAVHIVNNSYLFNMLFTIFKPFIREKLRKRIYFHNKDWNSLHQHVTKAILRPKFGGTLDAPEIEGKLIGDLLKYYNKRFEDSNSVGYVDEMNKE